MYLHYTYYIVYVFVVCFFPLECKLCEDRGLVSIMPRGVLCIQKVLNTYFLDE